MKKKFTILLLAVVATGFILCGCGSPPDLKGTWRQVNSNSDTTWQEATITDSTITINWISNNGDTSMLYWEGSYTAPTSTDTPYTWTSNGDTEKMSQSVLGSVDPTKDITYDGKQITYTTTSMGISMTVKLEKQN